MRLYTENELELFFGKEMVNRFNDYIHSLKDYTRPLVRGDKVTLHYYDGMSYIEAIVMRTHISGYDYYYDIELQLPDGLRPRSYNVHSAFIMLMEEVAL